MCDFIRVSGVWCGIGVVLVWFDPKSTFLKTRKRNKLGHYRISTLSEGFHCREQQYIPDARTVCQQHYETVNAVADAARRRHAEFEGVEEVLVGVVCFIVACFGRSILSGESLTLVDRIVEL